MKRALVIGSASMVGKELTRQLRDAGHGVVTSARSGPCDLPFDMAATETLPPHDMGPVDVLFVCAASFADDSWSGCVKNTLVNTVGLYRVAEWAERLRCSHVVMASSTSAHSEIGAPTSSYGLSKAQGEEVLEWAGQKAGFKTTSLRLPQLCDDLGECAKHQPWFARIVARAWSGQDLLLAPNDQPRNFLHVSDAAHAMIGSFNFGLAGVHTLTSPEFVTYRQIATMAYQIFGAGGRVIEATEMKPFRKSFYPPPSPEVWAVLGEKRVGMEESLHRIKRLDTGTRFGTAAPAAS